MRSMLCFVFLVSSCLFATDSWVFVYLFVVYLLDYFLAFQLGKNPQLLGRHTQRVLKDKQKEKKLKQV